MSEPVHSGVRVPSRGTVGGRRFSYVLLSCVALFALLLRLTDHVPAWLRGEPRGVQRYESVDALERDLHTRLLVPAYFPDVLQWPPARVALSAGDGQPTLIALRDRTTGEERVLIAQSIRGDFAIPSRLLPPGEVIESRDLDVGGRPARLNSVRGPDGVWTDLSLVTEGRRVVIRVLGVATPPDLLRLVRSLHRRRV